MKTRKLFLLGLLFAAFLALPPSSGAAAPKEEWVQVRSKNFYLIGNASEKDIRKVATKLEQFRETFRLVFRSMNLTAAVPTNVVVFKSDSSYRPFKPKRGDGKIDDFVAGYFQPGEDVNYITLSTDRTNGDPFGIIFHEYVHFIIDTNFGKSAVPAWFNEGLAEYYQTFEIEDDQKAKLGLLQDGHLALLQQNQLIPLGTFFNVSHRALTENGNHSRSLFYAQAWALIHFLVQSGKSEGMSQFLKATMTNTPPEQAFQAAFGIGYAQMEKDLRKYVEQRSYNFHIVSFKQKLSFDTDMQAAPMDEADTNAYLGDLLYHVNRVNDAEPFLRNALAQKPESGLANTALGMVKIRQNKYDEARAFLEKAIAQDPKNHIAYFRYAFLLSRDGRDEFGYVYRFDAAVAAKMRELLKKAIEINPAYTESYELLAFVNMVNNEQLDDSIALLRNALKYQPGNARYTMRIAEILLRQRKFPEAIAIAKKIEQTAEEPDLRSRAANLAREIQQVQQVYAEYETAKTKTDDGRSATGSGVNEPILLRRKPGEEAPSLEQMAAATAAAILRGINQNLRPVGEGEQRVIGKITKIECKNGNITYAVKTDTETFNLSSKDFQGLTFTTFVEEAGRDVQVSCTADLSIANAVLTYRPAATPKPPLRGELIAIEFVPENFRLIDLNTEPKPPTYVVEDAGLPVHDKDSIEQRRRMITEGIRQSLRKPGANERRDIGFVEKIECSGKGIFLHIKTAGQMLRLANTSSMIAMHSYTAGLEGLQMGCGVGPIDIPVVFIFKEDAKTPGSGDLVSLEFVPKGFRLD